MTKRFRSLVIALVALALSAGVVFAAHSMPTVASNGLATAGTHAAKTVPVEPDKGDQAGDDQAKPDTADKDDQAKPDTADKDDQAKPDTADTTTHPDNHGKLVSEAAHLTTPAGFRNHGAYVSSIARGDHGSAGKGHGEAPKPPTTPTTTH
jgi:hypothetical protein